MRRDDIPTCPECGAALDWDEVDIGVGVQTGNHRCTECSWTDQSGRSETTEQGSIEDDDDLPW